MLVKNIQDLQVNKLKVGIYATPSKNSVIGPYHHTQGRSNYSFPQLRERTKKTYFDMYCFK